MTLAWLGNSAAATLLHWSSSLFPTEILFLFNKNTKSRKTPSVDSSFLNLPLSIHGQRLRPLQNIIMAAHTCSFFALLLTIGHVAATGRRPRFEPLPMCLDCVPYEEIVAHGIGFDLTTSYATAAIRYHDGTVENLVKVGCGVVSVPSRSLTVSGLDRRSRWLPAVDAS